MEILSVHSSEFRKYGKVIEGYDTKELLQKLDELSPCPDEGTVYKASDENLEKLQIKGELQKNAYGGMRIQIGWCNGHNTKLNCLEYHRDSEINIGSGDFILLLALRSQIGKGGKLDTSKVKAFKVPAGVVVEVFATTLHYAPCSAKKGDGFRVIVVLPKGTNEKIGEVKPKNGEDELLFARNKWLLAHKSSAEAKGGAPVRLKGKNIDIANLF